ncbi:MAG TPA: dTDP-glucose 4,6-dehydratase [Crenotrichaceae bacterium]|nr:dTDP-glucose 4,6-dehydratase [Crenotrichaceae bacterium]
MTTNEDNTKSTILVTGGAGFIGGNFVLRQIQRGDTCVVNLDALTYAGHLATLESIQNNPDHHFVLGSISDSKLVDYLLETHDPMAIVNFAAESHVDRSIDNPNAFLKTNVEGTFELLESTRNYWNKLPSDRQQQFRFLHVSTDEVYGSLGKTGKFTENNQYRPNSPYSASKAAADHFVRCYFKTYGLPTLTTNCSNNYGYYQFPEKLIPLMIQRARNGQSLPIYGKGDNVRDWLFVEDHCEALETVLNQGKPGQVYNVGGNNEMSNLELVKILCGLLDEMLPDSPHCPHHQLIEFVTDRPGHDMRYAIDASKISNELNWQPKHNFQQGLRKTVRWYLDHQSWCETVLADEYAGERLGVV